MKIDTAHPPLPGHFLANYRFPPSSSALRCKTRLASNCTSAPEIVEPVDEWRVHESSNREKRSQGQGKHHAEKASVRSGHLWQLKVIVDNAARLPRFECWPPLRASSIASA